MSTVVTKKAGKSSPSGEASPNGEAQEAGAAVALETLKQWYRQMVLIRRFEEEARIAYQQGKIGGFLHLYIGEEAIAVGAVNALRPQDHIVTHYRDHGHAIVRGLDPKRLMAELYGKETGVAKGRGGSMHFADATKNFWGGYAIVAGHVTIAVGLALAAQRAKEDRVAMVFFGDGSTDNGQFYECLNLAALWKLPVIFMCENNQYGMGVAIDKASAVTDVHHKARMANIESVQVDGMNALAVHEAVQKAVKYASGGQGPYFIEALCYRYQGHSVADPDKYRDPEKLEEWKKRDAIERIRALLVEQGLSDEDISLINADVEREIKEIIAFAETSPAPAFSTLYDYTYAEPEHQAMIVPTA
jgi:pyruvate dehydrogenase E1 component alpha subunit